MADAGLAARARAEHDRRAFIVSLTAGGEALREPLADLWTTLGASPPRSCTGCRVPASSARSRNWNAPTPRPGTADRFPGGDRGATGSDGERPARDPGSDTETARSRS
ncbi:hypothetical protein [Streptomyces sp. NPDC001076]